MTSKLKLAPFDAAEHLDSEETIACYLTIALEDPDPRIFLAAVSDVVRARGMKKVAGKARLGRESLYKTLTPGAKPRYETIQKLMESLGMRLVVEPA